MTKLNSFGEKTLSEINEKEWEHLKSLNDRFVRWQEKQITLLTFSINLFFTISIATVGLIINNFDDEIFKDKLVCSYSLPKTAAWLIVLSSLLGIAALLCRLCDFRYTKDIIRTRVHLFKLKNNLKYENERILIKGELNDKIVQLRCYTKNLGKATWFLFCFQVFLYIFSVMTIVWKI